MMKSIRLCIVVCFFYLAVGIQTGSGKPDPIIGQSEKVYTLASKNQEIRGLAFDDVSPQAPRLFVLDQSGKIFAYRLNQNLSRGIDELKLLDYYTLPSEKNKFSLTGPRGLAYAWEKEREIFYVLNWDKSGRKIKSQLWRCNFRDRDHTRVDLTDYWYRIWPREVVDLVYDQ